MIDGYTYYVAYCLKKDEIFRYISKKSLILNQKKAMAKTNSKSIIFKE